MDYRRDLTPPILGLALSAALHGALLGLNVRLPQAEPPVEVVAVELFAPEATPPAPPVPQPVRPEPSPRAPPEPRPVRPVRPEPPPSPPPRPEPAPVQARSAPEAVPAPATPPPPAAAPEPPSLKDLMPRPADLQAFATSSAPDRGAREATLSLETTDERYRGYLDRVRTAVDGSWRGWREALLAAGRSGQVVVRVSLRPGGQVDDVQVVQSSGSSILDDEAVAAVRRSPVPPFPAHWTLERLHLVAQFDYRLE